ncbi:hypothetical protein PSTH1771_25865 [Pseudomonas syringae pv. theae]|nr:hypothetical protein [Pseudomonas syringae]GKS08511.1 hypothetical protein PSTH1771_25865 [Pseudomonas syringae pv. theae]
MNSVDPKKNNKPAQTLSVAAMQYIAARKAGKNDGGGHCQGGGGW